MILYDIIWYYMILYDIIWYYMILYDIIWYYMILYDLWKHLEIFPDYDFRGPKRPSSHHPRCAVFGMWALAVFFGQGKSIRTWARRSARHPSEVHLKSIRKRSPSVMKCTPNTKQHPGNSWNLCDFWYKLLTVWICTAACSHHHTPVMRRIWDSRHLWLQCCGRTYKNGWFPSNWCHFQGWNLSTIVKIC